MIGNRPWNQYTKVVMFCITVSDKMPSLSLCHLCTASQELFYCPSLPFITDQKFKFFISLLQVKLFRPKQKRKTKVLLSSKTGSAWLRGGARPVTEESQSFTHTKARIKTKVKNNTYIHF